jgi:hypothetical protein
MYSKCSINSKIIVLIAFYTSLHVALQTCPGKLIGWPSIDRVTIWLSLPRSVLGVALRVFRVRKTQFLTN